MLRNQTAGSRSLHPSSRRSTASTPERPSRSRPFQGARMMPRYFFHVVDGKFLVDDEGTECAGPAEVREQAIETAGSILKDLAREYPSGLEWQMHVTDETKATVLRIRFSLDEVGLVSAPTIAVVAAA